MKNERKKERMIKNDDQNEKEIREWKNVMYKMISNIWCEQRRIEWKGRLIIALL